MATPGQTASRTIVVAAAVVAVAVRSRSRSRSWSRNSGSGSISSICSFSSTTGPVPFAGPTFLACSRKMIMMRRLMMTMMMMDAFRHIPDRVGGCGRAGGVGTPEQYHRKSRAVLLGIYSTFVMSDHLV